MVKKAVFATCNLNQWALDFQGNYERILESIKLAKERQARFRTGPELEICGYSCEDHFYEYDTFLHSWQVLIKLLTDTSIYDIICDVGMPVLHKNVAYNCRVIFLDGQIILIRPKTVLCNEGNYKEKRWFSAWHPSNPGYLDEYILPDTVRFANDQETVPFGNAIIATRDTTIGFEMSAELWNPVSNHVSLALSGAEVIINSGAVHHRLGSAATRISLAKNASSKCGGLYIFSNHKGCDGDRLYFDGCCFIALNGEILVCGSQFSLKDVEIYAATVDIEDVRSYRLADRNYQQQASQQQSFQNLVINFEISSSMSTSFPINKPIECSFYPLAEELARGAACWLWDQLRRTGAGGFFLPLSGGLDSSSVACIVFFMCKLIYDEILDKNDSVLRDLRRILGKEDDYLPSNEYEICKEVLTTAYLATVNSSTETNERAKLLAKEINSYHLSFSIDMAVKAIINIFSSVANRIPKFAVHGGSSAENIALQNIQARLRMVISYFFAQLMLWLKGRSGFLLMLGSVNAGESLRGYITKYDCSSADINPIGSMNKEDLRLFARFCCEQLNITSMDSVMCAIPTAELQPPEAKQTDELDMGMSYDDLSTFGRMRIMDRCGPYSMYSKLASYNRNEENKTLAEKIKQFFRFYATNRHKAVVLTPSYFASVCSTDDSRFDQRPFLYNRSWTWQFSCIDRKLNMHF